ncbi:MAG: 50S ribosomal protein L13 [Nitrososphaeria archaeon]|nr:50S ribosomal protein L13 [Nitrososphaeria archaeon]
MKGLQTLEERKEVVIDAAMHKLGRAASKIAKMLLNGVSVKVVNAEKAIVTGRKEAILERYRFLISRRALVSPKRRTVWYPKRPERIFWYAIYRMLPRHNKRWKGALKRLKVYVGVPKELEDVEKITIPEAVLRDPKNRSGKLIRYMTLGELSRELTGGVLKLD